MNTIAKYTLVNDGQARWYADTQELVAALVAVGYRYERYLGHDTVAEPIWADLGHGSDPYSSLCARMGAVDREIVDPEEDVETMNYAPHEVGLWRMRVSRDLGEAVYAATPEVTA